MSEPAHLGAWCLRLAGALMLVVASFAARSQAPSPILVDGEELSKCLVAPSQPIPYPTGAAERKLGGVIRVRLFFSSADQPPRSEVFYDTVGAEFRQAVLDRIKSYRLPCLRPGRSVLLTQEFEFDPGDGRKVVSRPARDPAPSERKAASCITGGERPPNYPRLSSVNGQETQATVIAEFEVVSIEKPPRVQILFDGRNARFAAVIRDYVEGYRFPCLSPDDLPLKAHQVFRFAMEGDPVRLLNDLPLVSFLRNLDHLEREHVRFDFATMSCPFELRFQLLRPYLDNAVTELDRSDPNRREFIEWLRHVEVKLPASKLTKVLGDAMTLSVPCGVLDLL